MENKDLICKALVQALKLTRNQEDLAALDYNPYDETVIATYDNGATRRINVAMDSGTAMIRDIMYVLD